MHIIRSLEWVKHSYLLDIEERTLLGSHLHHRHGRYLGTEIHESNVLSDIFWTSSKK